MINRTEGQLILFVAFVFCGVILGIVYSAVFLCAKKNRVFIDIIKDLVFGLFSCVVITLFFYRLLNFEFKIFALIGIACGFFLCRLLCGNELDSIFYKLYNKSIKILKGLVAKNANERKNTKVHYGFGGCFSFCIGTCDDYPYIAKSTTQPQRKTTSRRIATITRFKRRNRGRSRW